jgi:hypothetical protein
MSLLQEAHILDPKHLLKHSLTLESLSFRLFLLGLHANVHLNVFFAMGNRLDIIQRCC